MLSALNRVISNKGSHGVDGMKIDELRDHIKKHWNTIRAKLLEARYNASHVRRVEIPKPDGGVRLLGIPTVQDRLIQQAIAQVLSKIYESSFSDNSFGFSPRRGAKDAITKSKEYINQGNRWVVDMYLFITFCFRTFILIFTAITIFTFIDANSSFISRFCFFLLEGFFYRMHKCSNLYLCYSTYFISILN